MPNLLKTNILIIGTNHDAFLARLHRVKNSDCSVFSASTPEQAAGVTTEYEFAVIFLIINTSLKNELGYYYKLMTNLQSTYTPLIIVFDNTISDEDLLVGYEAGASDIIDGSIKDPILKSKMNTFTALFKLRISSQNLSAEQLKTSEEKYKSIFDTSRDGIVFMSLEGHIENANQAYCAMLGYEIQELIFTTSTQHTPYKWQIRDDEILKSQVMQRGYSDEYQKEYIKKDNRVFPVMVRVCLVRDKKNQPLRLLKVVRDITEQSQLELRLRQSHKMESVGTIAGGIAHDFNNILGAIIGYAQLAKYSVPENSMAAEDIENIIIASGRAKDLVTHILGFSRASEQVRQPVQLHFLVNEVLKLIRASLPSTIEIKKNIALKNTSIMADSTEMHQVVMNLCTNAFHAMEVDCGILEVNLEPVEIHQTDFSTFPELKPGAYVKLCVNDTGYGISPDVIERIFDPYFTTKEKGSGTGLGLSVVHGIIKSHGGGIHVQSTVGSGTSVTILFPRLEVSPQIIENEHSPLTTGTEKILFVDDEPSLVYVEKIMLQKLGYHVISAPSGIEAYEIFSMRPDFFDIIITDMTMPGMTGLELTEKIQELRPETPVILCTGYNNKITDENAREKGISRVLLKPVEIRDLSIAIRELL